MKLSNVLSLACLATLTSAGTPCGKDKLPNVANAINKFCSNQGIVVPSTYAIQGASGAFDRGHVSIAGTSWCAVSLVTCRAEHLSLGTCNPSQWVPKEYCLSQFRMMCSNGRKVRKFGRNGCQTWVSD